MDICILARALSSPVMEYQKYISIGGFVERPIIKVKNGLISVKFTYHKGH